MNVTAMRAEFAKAVSAMIDAGVKSAKIDDCKFAFEFTVNPDFRKAVADMVEMTDPFGRTWPPRMPG